MIKRTLYLLLLSSILTLPAGSANATQLVLDKAAIGKLVDQLTAMQEQFEQMVEINTKLQDQIDAIGKAGQISLPLINAAKMASQIRQDMQCLKPDFSKLMPNIEFENLNWDSVCEGRTAYRDTLWLDPQKLNELTSWQERDAAAKEGKERRTRVLADAAENGLALGDIGNKEVERTLDTASEIEAQAKAAKTKNERLAVIAESQAVIIRSRARTNQLLAQLLKVQSAYVIKAGVDLKSGIEGEDTKGGEQ